MLSGDERSTSLDQQVIHPEDKNYAHQAPIRAHMNRGGSYRPRYNCFHVGHKRSSTPHMIHGGSDYHPHFTLDESFSENCISSGTITPPSTNPSQCWNWQFSRHTQMPIIIRSWTWWRVTPLHLNRQSKLWQYHQYLLWGNAAVHLVVRTPSQRQPQFLYPTTNQRIHFKNTEREGDHDNQTVFRHPASNNHPAPQPLVTIVEHGDMLFAGRVDKMCSHFDNYTSPHWWR